MEGDSLLWCNPPPVIAHERMQYFAGQFPLLLKFWIDQGFNTIILSNLMTESAYIKKTEEIGQALGFSTHTFTLWSDWETTKKRILERNNMGRPECEFGSAERCYNEITSQDYIGAPINTEHITIEENASQIQRAIAENIYISDSEVSLRPMTSDDLRSLLDWYVSDRDIPYRNMDDIPKNHPWLKGDQRLFHHRTILFQQIPVGVIMMVRMDRNEINFGFSINPEYKRKGITSSACRLMVQRLPIEFPNFKVSAGTMPENKAAHKILQKVGFIERKTRWTMYDLIKNE